MGTKFARRLRRQRHIGLSFDSLALLALHHARLAADDAASGRAGASGASATCLSMPVCRRSAAGHAQGPRGRSDGDPLGKSAACGTSLWSQASETLVIGSAASSRIFERS
jgi:hypothetical protein